MDAFLKQLNLKYCSRTTAPWIGRRALIPWCQVWLQGGAECLCLYSMFIMCLRSSGFAFNWSQPFSPHSSPIINDQHHNPTWLPDRQGVLYNCGLFNRLLIKHSYWINKLRGGCWGNIFPKHSRVAKALDQSVCAQSSESHLSVALLTDAPNYVCLSLRGESWAAESSKRFQSNFEQ